MSGKGRVPVPDAWEDDWETLADKPAEPAKPEPAPKLTKAERRAQHVEQQKQLWDSADNPDRFHWLETQGVVPLKQEFKQPVTLLARKPPTIAKKNTAEGIAKLNLQDEEDSEEERRKVRESDFEERQRKAKIERAEKERRYAEARERIMGSNSQSPASNSRESSQARDNRRGRGGKTPSRRSQPHSPAEHSPARQPGADNKLFDPDDMSRRLAPKRELNSTVKEDQPLRQPRGPDQSGRGGFGFGNRGGLPS
ncbi:uncharacterized protein MYCFIDRAFT_192995 [Pseudocercospora fijiensis CIRAD86]|uniref:SUZ-C domain-containing protein n=1 Tax=Pseudocercospora fijiensis (strain CIRAD86) TaxID=383855 RepID=N1QC85_PSEFD|nr:uncharacterized protein MYCFIDRAFT_192995 [Pseudocercospora fijiensis CIRAD86]EME88958.1 hypothetical protein MYCFIDRAFT_192995 [Pseudocercospora fijiensis CIRAD86]